MTNLTKLIKQLQTNLMLMHASKVVIFNDYSIRLNRLLLKPGIRLTVPIVWSIMIYILLCPTSIVYAMEHDREIIKNAFEAGDNAAEVRRILEELRNITDPARIAQINTIIAQLSVQYGIPMDLIHGNATLTIANTGVPPAEASIDWRNVFIRAAIFVGASAVVYLIYRNFHHLTDLFRDIGERAIDMGVEQFNRLGALAIINHSPEARHAFIIEMARILATTHPRSPGSIGG